MVGDDEDTITVHQLSRDGQELSVGGYMAAIGRFGCDLILSFDYFVTFE
jgi:hypothetical protein